MKKEWILLITALLFINLMFTACAKNIPKELEPTPPLGTLPVEVESPNEGGLLDGEEGIEEDTKADTEAGIEAEPEADTNLDANLDEHELCPICGEHYVNEELRSPTPPLHIQEWHMYEGGEEAYIEAINTFLSDFETVHTASCIQWDTEQYSSLVVWTDVPLRNVSFLSLGYGYTKDQEYFYTKETLLTVDELLPRDALLLNVAFLSDIFPGGGLVFTDESGVEKRMFISESLRGGCFPQYFLLPYDSPISDWADWN